MPFEINRHHFFQNAGSANSSRSTFNLNGRNSSVQIGAAMTVAVEPIKNPVTGEPESVRVHHATGFIFKEAECFSAAQMNVNAGELKFSWPNIAALSRR